MSVDEQYEIRFSIPQGTLLWQLIFAGFNSSEWVSLDAGG